MKLVNTGKLGEDFTAERLIAKGYEIVARNYHSRYGEIDIIAVKNQTICFIEVKTRETDALVSPFEAVTKSKQKKIIMTAEAFLQSYPVYDNYQPRFDVAGITIDRNNRICKAQYIADAFNVLA